MTPLSSIGTLKKDAHISAEFTCITFPFPLRHTFSMVIGSEPFSTSEKVSFPVATAEHANFSYAQSNRDLA